MGYDSNIYAISHYEIASTRTPENLQELFESFDGHEALSDFFDFDYIKTDGGSALAINPTNTMYKAQGFDKEVMAFLAFIEDELGLHGLEISYIECGEDPEDNTAWTVWSDRSLAQDIAPEAIDRSNYGCDV